MERDSERAAHHHTSFYLVLVPAGTGKSRTANEFAKMLVISSQKLIQEALDNNADPVEWRKLEKRLLDANLFRVSLENGTYVTSGEKQDPLGAVGFRMLYQLLEEKEGHLFEAMEKYAPLHPRGVLKSVVKYQKEDYFKDFTGVLVVDGVQNLMLSDDDRKNKESEFYVMLSDLFNMSLEGAFIIVCCTATCFVPMKSFLAKTFRRRVFLDLHPLDPPKIVGKPVFDNSDPLIRVIVSDCDGHGRALPTLLEVINMRPFNGEVTGDNVTDIMRRTLQSLTEKYETALSWGWDTYRVILRAILARTIFERGDTIPGTSLTIDENLSPGLIRFDPINPRMNEVGRISAGYIWVWALHESCRIRGHLRNDPSLHSWTFLEYDQIASSFGKYS